MKKLVVKIILIILLLIIGIGGIKVGTIFYNGYEMYKAAIDEVKIEDKIGEIKEKDDYVSLKDIAPEFLKELILSEDKRFMEHSGFDFMATTRAMANNIKARSFIQGGSTITQQLSKNLYFTFEKRFERKVAEVLVAFELEKKYTKEEILEYYCNVIYFGEGCYGIKAAANHYYGIDPLELKDESIEILVNTIKSPNDSNPNVIEGMNEKAMR